MTMNINIRRYDGSIVGEESQFTKLDLIQRHQDVDSWAVTVPDTAMALALRQPGAGISVRRNGAPFLSGPMTRVERVYSDTDNHFIISGLSDECYLWDRVIQPSEPESLASGLFQFAAYDSITAPAETVMKHYVAINLGDLTRSVPGTPSLSMTPDLGRGLQVVGQARFDLLGDLIKTFGIYSNNMGFTMKDFQFDVYEPNNFSAAAVFSVESGNVVSYAYTNSAPKVTHPYVAGGGQLDQRVFYIGGDDVAATTWGRRIESFIDARDTTDPLLLAQRAQTAITNGASQTTVTLRPRDVPNRTFGVDYGLGDVVKISGVTATLGQVELTLDQNGETIIPTGSAQSSAAAQATLQAFDDLRSLRRQILALQTSA